MTVKSLLLTATEHLIAKDTLMLGKWCKNTRNSEHQTFAYPWNNRKLLEDDYSEATKMEELLLLRLTGELNFIHKTDFKVDSWRIILGAWLGVLTQVIAERQRCLLDCLESNKDIDTIFVKDLPSEPIVPVTTIHFFDLTGVDVWNDWLYQKLIDGLGRDFHLRQVVTTKAELSEAFHSKPSIKLKAIKRLLNRISGALKTNRSSFIVSSYLGWRGDLSLYMKLGQAPKYWWSEIPKLHDIEQPSSMRKEFVARLIARAKTDHEKVVSEIVADQIPQAFLEDFLHLSDQAKTSSWPTKPRVIFTSNGTWFDEVFKIWAAERRQSENTRLVLSQHGGNYGISKLNFAERMEVSQADTFVSWGWNDSIQQNVVPLSSGKLFNQRIRHHAKNEGSLLLVQASFPRYSNWIGSFPIGPQTATYFDQQRYFFEELSNAIQKKSIVRLYPKDFGWYEKEKWLKRFPSIEFDPNPSMYNSMARCKLFVCSYNATTYLESLSSGIPTIMFWDPDLWEIREDALPYFSALENLGILHYSPDSAAAYINRIWADIENWWNEPERQKVVSDFTFRFARSENDWVDQLASVLKQ
jgi:putative transferase (TIGR04331 family)